MNELLRILLVEDDPSDRFLVSTMLARDFPHVKILEINGPKALSGALQAANFDLVVTDYQLQWTTGLDVLMEIRARLGDLPVIMFTGTGTEEVAVAGMKAGLDDYVLKKPAHLVRLTAAVRTALERKRERDRARSAESFSRSLFEGLPVALFRTDPSGMITDANEALVSLLRCPARAALVGTSLFDWTPDANVFRALYQRTDPIHRYPLLLRSFDGGPLWVRADIRPVPDTRGTILFREGLFHDLSEQKSLEDRLRKIEEELAQLRRRLETPVPKVPL